MLNMTDAELRDLGWKYALRDEAGTLLAVTVCALDAGGWIRKERGVVVSLNAVADRP